MSSLPRKGFLFRRRRSDRTTPAFYGFTSFFAIKDQSEVGTLSGRGNGPYPAPLQGGIRFFRPPLPALSTAFLAVDLPLLYQPVAKIRAYRVP
ncbi:hypothetical protein FCG41_20870 [Azotobacter chroococcum]|nr:hypothetical protein FCG41_20870 [Azotobacter chroococcum]